MSVWLYNNLLLFTKIDIYYNNTANLRLHQKFLPAASSSGKLTSGIVIIVEMHKTER